MTNKYIFTGQSRTMLPKFIILPHTTAADIPPVKTK